MTTKTCKSTEEQAKTINLFDKCNETLYLEK